MNRFNMSKKALFVEGIIILAAIVYAALQIIYGVIYHITPLKYMGNILVVVAVYAIMTYLYMRPWRIHRIPKEECIGDVRKYSRHMTQAVKLVFNIGLLVPCVCDILAKELKEGFSAILILVLVAVVIYYEWKILQAIRRR